MAEVAFQRAHGRCDPRSADARGLTGALALYRRTLDPAQGPHTPSIRAKLAFGLGRTYLCLSQAGFSNRWADAEAQFLEVTRAYDARSHRLRELASEAYADLGLVYLPRRKTVDTRAAYQRAATAYQQAISLSLDPKRQGLFYAMRAHIHSQLGEIAAACQSYAEAVSRDPASKDYSVARTRLGCPSDD